MWQIILELQTLAEADGYEWFISDRGDGETWFFINTTIPVGDDGGLWGPHIVLTESTTETASALYAAVMVTAPG